MALTGFLFHIFVIILITNWCTPAKCEKSNGVDYILKMNRQQPVQSVPCLAHITQRYLLWQQKNESIGAAIFIANFPKNVTAFANVFLKDLITEFEYAVCLVVKNSHVNQSTAMERKLGFSYRATSYFMFVNETGEVERNIR